MTTQFRFASGRAHLVGEQDGVGETLIYLHAGVADRRMWHYQMADLQISHHVVAYDCRGFGETTSPDEPFSHVEDLVNLLDHLELSNVALCGCSQGGRIALDFSLAFPERVRSLVLLAPAVSGAPGPRTLPSEISSRFDDLEEAEKHGDLERVNRIEANLWLDGPLMSAGRVSGAARDLFLDMNGKALQMPELTQEAAPAPAWERLCDIVQRTLVLWGEHDFPHIKERCRQLISSIPVAEGEEIPATAHLPNLEKPDHVNRLIRAGLSLG